MVACLRRNEVAPQTPPHARFQSPAQPLGDYLRGKASSASSEPCFKLTLNVRKTIRRPRAAQQKMKCRTCRGGLSDLIAELPDFRAFNQIGRRENQLFRRP